MEIIQNPRKPKPWAERLEELEVGESFYVEVSAAQTVSSTVSRIKQFRPELNWTVVKNRDTKSGEMTHATVTRTA